jgi:hypothetical protein
LTHSRSSISSLAVSVEKQTQWEERRRPAPGVEP